MSSWSHNRRMVYGGSVVVVVLLIVGWIAFSILYKPPTCSDGIMNGDERDVDCGGSCVKLCASAFFPPQPKWTHFEELAPGFYNVAAYIVNPNTEGAAVNVPYHFVLYDDKGVTIVDSPGYLRLPPHRNTLAFQSAVPVGKRTPVRALFEFTGIPDWKRQADPLTALEIADKIYTEDESGSSLMVTLKNTSVRTLGKMTVYAVLSDADTNVVGFSKTVIDGILPQSSVQAPFTWPVNRHGAVISKEVYPVAE